MECVSKVLHLDSPSPKSKLVGHLITYIIGVTHQEALCLVTHHIKFKSPIVPNWSSFPKPWFNNIGFHVFHFYYQHFFLFKPCNTSYYISFMYVHKHPFYTCPNHSIHNFNHHLSNACLFLHNYSSIFTHHVVQDKKNLLHYQLHVQINNSQV